MHTLIYISSHEASGFYLFLFTTQAFSQSKQTLYLELQGPVDAMGNMSIYTIPPPKKMSHEDSLMDYKQINASIVTQSPMKTMNKLAQLGWQLVTVAQITQDEFRRPASAFIAYYFKKEFEQ